MSSFRNIDFMNIEDLLQEEERMVRDTVREFVSKEVLPIIEECFIKGRFPEELVPKIAELGLLGANLEGYGCAGLNNVAYGLICQELERGDSGIRSFVSVQGALVMYPIHTFGSEEQKEKWIPKLASGEVIGAFGLTEPDFGSNPGGMMTKAEKVDGGYVLNGSKMWITNASMADLSVIWAKLDGVVHGFLVEKDREGYTAREIRGKHSLRASDTSEIFLEDCFVPEENRLPGANGLSSPLMCLTQARYGISWGALGAAMDCYQTALDYSLERKQFSGKPIASHQLVQRKLVRMLDEITKGQLLCLQLGRLKDSGRMHYVQVSMAKRNNVAMALDIARMARDILGASGIVNEYSVMRHMNNLESVKTYEGAHDIHILILGHQITGISAFE
jgi:glutaryl-CoA dehydrogenase